jgi:choline dehydrogenase
MKFDYVLVGGGTAACVLASQLIEREMGTVAVIESGCVPVGARISTPVRYTETFSTSWDYGLQTEPQAELANRRLAWPRGRMLGGSSGMNAMIYIPPCREELDSWPSSWRGEQIESSLHDVESRLFGIDYVEPEIHPLSNRFLEAIDEHNRQHNREDLIDMQAHPSSPITPVRFRRTQHNGRRRSAYSVFLKPILNHSRLTVIENAHASKIWLDDTGAGTAQARAVEFHQHGGSHLIEAERAVVLTSGPIFSPAILMRSGIGSKDHLSDQEIDMKLDLPGVGQNLQDHLIVPLVFESKNQTSLEKHFSTATRLEYLQSRSGAKCSNIAEVGAFMRVNRSRSPCIDVPAQENIQLHFTPTHYLEYPTRKSPIDAWTIGVTQCNPRSRGEVRLTRDDKSPFGVSIDPKYLNERDDLSVLVRAIQQAISITRQPALSHVLGPTLIPRGLVDLGDNPDSLDRQLEKLVRRYAMTLYHPVGTCAMGDCAQAVVDYRLKVHGTDNLYIADSSIIPTIPIGNPQSFAMLIGYHAAKMILESQA